MASVYDLKPRFQALLRPMVGALYKAGVTANHVTVGALLFSILYGISVGITQQPTWLLLMPVVLFVRMALNAIDGMLAREFNQKSDLGCFLNELSDVIADAALYLPFLFFMPGYEWLIWTFVSLSILTEYSGVVAVMIGKSRRYDGPLGKSDRATLMSILALLIGFHWITIPWIVGAMAVASLLAAYTSVRRIQRALQAEREIG